jgi:protein TonB
MSYTVNNEQKINDIIFANRNKNYGTYAIRSTYGNTLVKSISIMAFGFISLMGSAYYYSHRNNKPDQNNSGLITRQDTNITIVCDLKKPDELVEKPREPENQQKQKTSTEKSKATIVKDTIALTTATVATTPINTGIATSSVTTTDGGTTAGTSTTTAIASNSPTNSGNKTHTDFEVDSNPEFDGGLPALYKFVGSKLKYPPMAYADNKEGTVYVKFVVDENGKVCNLNLLNHAGYGMDEEALRVVGMIPNFKTPAKVKGKAVKVYYQLPIKYKMKY